MKVSLKLKSGTAVEAESGYVQIEGNCVTLYGGLEGSELLLAYCLLPGEIVRRESEGVYLVEF